MNVRGLHFALLLAALSAAACADTGYRTFKITSTVTCNAVALAPTTAEACEKKEKSADDVAAEFEKVVVDGLPAQGCDPSISGCDAQVTKTDEMCEQK